jgi:hypothetical protein
MKRALKQPSHDVACGKCGAEMRVPHHDVMRGRGKYCSTHCRVAAFKPKEPTASRKHTRVCKGCASVFSVTKAQVQHGDDSYCSAPCYARSQKRHRNASLSKPVAAPKPTYLFETGTGQVRCAGPCQQMRPRGSLCPRCEYRAMEATA